MWIQGGECSCDLDPVRFKTLNGEICVDRKWLVYHLVHLVVCLSVSPSVNVSPVSVGEPGELVGKIVKGDPVRNFDGYICKDATNKKICYDVFSKGDHCFLTGRMCSQWMSWLPHR